MERKLLNILSKIALTEDPHKLAGLRSELRQVLHGVDLEKAATREEGIRDILTEVGVPAHLAGYEQVVRLIERAMDRNGLVGKWGAGYLDKVAAEFGISTSMLERRIRHVCQVSQERGDYDILNRYFGDTIDPDKGSATPKQFVVTLANAVKVRMKEN